MDENKQKEIFLSQEDRDGLYKTIFARRDVRGQFLSDEIPVEVLARILKAAHHAPSVGFMQPWNFLLVKSDETKQNIHAAFIEANKEGADMFEGERRDDYKKLKLEGILDSPINICVTCDRSRSGPVVLGRTAMKSMDLYSSVCAIQNLWLAARAEGLGLGWVSIIKEKRLKEILNIPRDIVVVGYLCLGYVSEFYTEPELETVGWRGRMPLEDLVFFDQWENTQKEHPLIDQIKKNKLT